MFSTKIDGMTFKNHKCDQSFQWLPASPQILLESLICLLGSCMTRPLPSSPAWAQATLPSPSTHRPLMEFKQCRPLSPEGLPHLPLGLEPSSSSLCILCLANTQVSFTCHILKGAFHVTPRLDQIPGYTLLLHNVLFLYRNTPHTFVILY